ncbi:MAG: winged helix-turn-helix transcriptional regulator [Solirubrobacteraceae bacterium]
MPLANDYPRQTCSVARSLEVVGERWTLLIVRDAFYGVRRFGDFATHLDIPRAVLATRLKTLVAEDVLRREPGPGGHDEYALTEKGVRLWPVVRDLMAWGDEYYTPQAARRVFRHDADDGTLDPSGRCATCGEVPDVADTVIELAPGFGSFRRRDDPVTRAIGARHRLLEPVRAGA